MGGTKIGGLRTAATNKVRYGADYYKTIGRMGGIKSQGGGFAEGEAGRLRASEAGRKGGLNYPTCDICGKRIWKRSMNHHCEKSS